MLSNSTRCLLQFKKEIYGAIYYKFRHAFVSYRESLYSRLSAESCRFVFINQRTFCLQFYSIVLCLQTTFTQKSRNEKSARSNFT